MGRLHGDVAQAVAVVPKDVDGGEGHTVAEAPVPLFPERNRIVQLQGVAPEAAVEVQALPGRLGHGGELGRVRAVVGGLLPMGT